MKPNVKIYLVLDRRKNRLRSDGSSPVVVKIPSGNHGITIDTGVDCHATNWDSRTMQCTHQGARVINSVLTNFLASVRTAVLTLVASGEWARITTPSEAKSAILRVMGGLPGEGRDTGITDYFCRMLERDHSRSKRTKDLYQWTLSRLRDFLGGRSPSFDELTVSDLKDFESYLKETGASINTISIHMRNLRAVYNQAIDEGVTENYPFRRYRVRSEVPLPKVLSVEEFRELWRAECLPDERRYLDIFFLGFLFRGMNIVDLSRLKEVDRDGYVSYRRSKTGYEYRIKVEPEAEEIIRRNRGQKLLIRTFENRDHLDVCSRLNHILKKSGGFGEVLGNGWRKRLPINNRLSYAWGRRSWATFAEELGVPLDTIRLALGHQIAGTARHYVKYNQSAVDEANRRVIDWVLYGKR